jgi:HD-like signal output (HDOD) protein/CheY-like chemotaxis protein
MQNADPENIGGENPVIKKRILFVDDEIMVLQGLQRMLHAFRNEWDMMFVESGAKALELMAQAPFDVVVADMRMPEMDGVELLKEVMQRYPQTMRLILSGYSDESLILKSVGVMHQYLTKPCSPDVLKAVVQRAYTLGTYLRDPKLKALIGHMERLPSLPSLYTEIMAKLRDPEVSTQDITSIITRDLGMTARILQLVNSAFFNQPQRITNLNTAVSYLGLNTIRSLFLTAHAFSQFEGIELPGCSLEEIWQHSLKTAVLAKKICGTQSNDASLGDDAFVAGILHDTGRFILSVNFPEEYRQAIMIAKEERCSLYNAEKKVFNQTHAAVGGYLLDLWGLPYPIVEAVYLHHEPILTGMSDFSALTAIHLANGWMHQQEDHSEDKVTADIDLNYLKMLNLENLVENSFKEEIA